jgi:polysaccharide biosynthesis transport protein
MSISLNCPEPDLDGSPRFDEMSRGSVYHRLLYTVFQKPCDLDNGDGVVVAFTSSNRREGVTYVSRQLANELGRNDMTSVACVNVNFLRRLSPTAEEIRGSRLKSGASFAGEQVAAESPKKGSLEISDRRGPWEGSWQYRRACIQLLRSEFAHTIIDCPALEESGDLFSVAPFVDGVIVVVEANRTRREQPNHAEQSIVAAGGKLLGYILNKRTYEVPQWLYRRL